MSLGVAGRESVYEAIPRMQNDMRLPLWAFSARAKHAPGGAPAVVHISQPKLQPDGIQVKTGETLRKPLDDSHNMTDMLGK